MRNSIKAIDQNDQEVRLGAAIQKPRSQKSASLHDLCVNDTLTSPWFISGKLFDILISFFLLHFFIACVVRKRDHRFLTRVKSAQK